MKLWLLERTLGSMLQCSNVDVANAFVIRAESEAKARKIASKYFGDEGANAWLDPEQSACTMLDTSGNAGVILRDYTAG